MSAEFGASILVCSTMVVAAVIDGWKLKVPNWLTYPFIATGWLWHLASDGIGGLGFSIAGTAIGLAVLLFPYIIGGMGAGDVKLFAGVGAWMGASFTFQAFFVSAIVGGFMAVAMVAYRGVKAHDFGVVSSNIARFQAVTAELFVIGSPQKLAELAAARKPTAMLLPYGIPLAVGTIGFMFWQGLV